MQTTWAGTTWHYADMIGSRQGTDHGHHRDETPMQDIDRWAGGKPGT